MNRTLHIDDDNRPPTPAEWLGIMLLWIGAGVLTLSVWERAAGLPFSMPGFWYRHQTLWGFIGAAVLIVGAVLVKKKPPEFVQKRWRANRTGLRFHRIELYTKAECPLCEEAAVIIDEYRDYLPHPELRDILSNPEWQAAYADKIPVVVCDGKVRFRGRVNEILLRRLIQGTKPVD
ncbi:MAG: glutaredoxin family protein [Planctomycetota bacterium]|nr:glutaredoxin family protein [Planctomycetota bacterium]MDA1214159.1 glutaredoxin family protein [Planctomycetota bacterium]